MAKPNPFTVISNPDALRTPRPNNVEKPRVVPALAREVQRLGGSTAIQSTVYRPAPDAAPIGPLESEKINVSEFDLQDPAEISEHLLGEVEKITDFFERRGQPIDINAARLRLGLTLVGDAVGQGMNLSDMLAQMYFRTERDAAKGTNAAPAVVAYDAISLISHAMSLGVEAKTSKNQVTFAKLYPSSYWGTGQQPIADTLSVLSGALVVHYDTDDRHEIVKNLDRSTEVIQHSAFLAPDEYIGDDVVEAAWSEYLGFRSDPPPIAS